MLLLKIYKTGNVSADFVDPIQEHINLSLEGSGNAQEAAGDCLKHQSYFHSEPTIIVNRCITV